VTTVSPSDIGAPGRLNGRTPFLGILGTTTCGGMKGGARAGYAELELSLHCLEQRQYAVELRFVGAGSKVEDRVELDRQNTVEIDVDDLIAS